MCILIGYLCSLKCIQTSLVGAVKRDPGELPLFVWVGVKACQSDPTTPPEVTWKGGSHTASEWFVLQFACGVKANKHKNNRTRWIFWLVHLWLWPKKDQLKLNPSDDFELHRKWSCYLYLIHIATMLTHMHGSAWVLGFFLMNKAKAVRSVVCFYPLSAFEVHWVHLMKMCDKAIPNNTYCIIPIISIFFMSSLRHPK